MAATVASTNKRLIVTFAVQRARDAAMRNFKTIMISDANASRNDDEHNATLSIFLQAFGGVFDTDEAIRLIGAGTAP